MSRKLKGNSTFSQLLTQLVTSNQKGFSLAEIMVAAGMLGVLSLGVSQLMQNSAKTEKRLSQQVNLITLDSQIMDALHDTTSCERTLGVIQGTSPNANTGGAFQPLPTNAIYRGNNPEVGTDAAKWNIAVQAYDGADAGIYGSGSNTVYVKAIEYAGFLKTSVDNKYSDPTNYDNASKTAIPGTGDFWGTVVLHVDFRRGNPASYESLGSDEARELKAKRSLYGQYKVPRFYKVNVRVNAANKIVSCYAYDEIMSDTYCSLLDGHLDMATGRCTNIKIRTSPFKAAESPADLWSMTAFTVDGQDGNSLVQGGFQVGGDVTEVPPGVGNVLIKGDTQDDGNIFVGDTSTISPVIPSPVTKGNVSAQNDLLVGRDAQVNRQFRSETEALFKGRVNMGPDTSIDNTESYLLKVTSATGNDRVIFDTTSANSSRIEMNNARGSNGKIQFNESTSEPFRILEGTDMVFRVNQTGRVDFYDGMGSGKYTTIVRNTGAIHIMNGSGNQAPGNARTIIGDGNPGDSYRPIRILGQGTEIADMRLSTVDQEREVPTKAWVKTMVYGEAYNDDKIQEILSNILEYAQHKPKDTIEMWACKKMRFYRSSNSDTKCDWDPVNAMCRCHPVNCSTASMYSGASTTASYCKDIYLTGRLTAEVVVGNQRVRSLFDVVANRDVLADRMVKAPEIQGTTKVFGQRIATNAYKDSVAVGQIYGKNLRANQNVCIDGGNCYTRFGKFMCPWQTVMIGIAYGQPVCTKVGN